MGRGLDHCCRNKVGTLALRALGKEYHRKERAEMGVVTRFDRLRSIYAE